MKVFSRISIVIVLLVLLVGNAQAQVNLEAGFFLDDPDVKISDKDFSIKLRGGENGGSSGAGLSLKVGRFIFGFETLGGQPSFKTGSVTGIGSDGGTLSSGFVSAVGPTHRAMMGIRLSRRVAVYGFHGLAGYSIQHELSYNNSSTVESTVLRDELVPYTETRYYKCKTYTVTGYRYETVERDISAVHTTTGYNYSSVDGLQNSIGAGMEAFVLGGVFRLEYNLIHTSGFSQSAKLHHTTSNNEIQNNNDQDTYNFKWHGKVDQLVQFRWKANF